MPDNPFAIPQSMREASQRNLEQAHAVYEQVMDFMTKAMDAWMGALPESPMTAGFKDVQSRLMEFAKENAEASFTLAGQISNAPTLPDVLTLQAQFAQERLQTFVAQTQQLFGVFGETFRQSGRGDSWIDIPTTSLSRRKTLFN